MSAPTSLRTKAPGATRTRSAGARSKGTRAAGAARYGARGVSATKDEVHAAIRALDQGLFPGAFCKITEDFLSGDPELCNVIHADGSGTKSILAYLLYRETGDASAFRGIAQDSIVMNLDDLLCVGATGRLLLSSTINRNARRVPAEVLAALISGGEAFLANLREQGIDMRSGGGETADVGDLTPTVLVDTCAVAVLRRSEVLTGEGIRPGLAIVGFSSAGQASYEDRPNSGIGSNGLTSARHDLLCSHYALHYPETVDAQTDPRLVYCGPFRLEDPLPGAEGAAAGMSVGEALLSPTRTYAPLVRALLREHPGVVRGLVHCSGGGQTKCLRFGRGVHFVKDALMEVPPIFRVIQQVSGTSWKEMYQVYNMGHRMEAFVLRRDVQRVVEVARAFGIAAHQIGFTERSADGTNRLTLHHGGRELTYAAT